jgi:hypothetical protein
MKLAWLISYRRLYWQIFSFIGKIIHPKEKDKTTTILHLMHALTFVLVPIDLLQLLRRAIISRHIPRRALGIVVDMRAWWWVDADPFTRVVVVVEVVVDEVASLPKQSLMKSPARSLASSMVMSPPAWSTKNSRACFGCRCHASIFSSLWITNKKYRADCIAGQHHWPFKR